jgi:hypothetical protein
MKDTRGQFRVLPTPESKRNLDENPQMVDSPCFQDEAGDYY